MGISGLLPFLEKASKPVNIKEYSGCTVAVDTYCWLHKGAFSCAEKLARGEQTDQYVVYCMKFVYMLLSHNIKPILVFDGRHLPAKAETEKVRKERRETNRKKAAELLRADRTDEARSLIRRCVDVTHEMASALMNKCRSVGVDCIVAPYEADAQLAFFSITGVAQVVITEDSDLMLFGCKKVMFKMDPLGNGLLVDQTLLPLAMKQPADKFSMDKFTYMCILSGCDYLPSLPGIGLAKACKFIKRTDDDNICRALSRLGSYLNMNSLVVTQDYKEKFMIALSMFKYQPIYDPFQRRLTTLNPLPEGKPLPIDEQLSPHTCFQLALGNLNPFTLVPTNNWDPDDLKNYKTSGWNSDTKKNSIWSKNYEARKIPKKTATSVYSFVTRTEKQATKTERKNIIEVEPSPKKIGMEEKLNQFRSLYGVTPPTQKVTSYLDTINVKDTENGNDSLLDDADCDIGVSELFGEDDVSPMRNSRNPFCKAAPVKKSSSQLTPLCTGLSRLSKLSNTPINDSNGEVSRYFASSYIEKEVCPETKNISEIPDNSPSVDNVLKDVINTPTKTQDIQKPETPTTARRNIFSASPNKNKSDKKDISSRNKLSPNGSRIGFLNMLDTMVDPIAAKEPNRNPKEVKVKSPEKKQKKLSFSVAIKSSNDSKNEADDQENTAPMKVTAFVKTLPSPGSSLQSKVETSPSTLMTTPKQSNNHKLGPAKTVGLKRKKSSTNNEQSKKNQPSIFEMFAFQPKAKLKTQ